MGAPDLDNSVLAVKRADTILVIVLEEAVHAGTVDVDVGRVDDPNSPRIAARISLTVVERRIRRESGIRDCIKGLGANWIRLIVWRFRLDVAQVDLNESERDMHVSEVINHTAESR